jgi:hypothetical protein
MARMINVSMGHSPLHDRNEQEAYKNSILQYRIEEEKVQGFFPETAV